MNSEKKPLGSDVDSGSGERTRENTVVSGPGVNSVFAEQAGEGPVTDESSDDSVPSTARQEGTPTIRSHDLGNEGMDDSKS